MKVFFMDPKRPIRESRQIEVEIIVCDKTSWAVLADGSRRLVGSSIFFTLASANRARRGALQKVVDDTALASMWKTREFYHQAKLALNKLKQGVLH